MAQVRDLRPAGHPWLAVHSPEHGAVWLTSCPDLRKDQIDALPKQAAAGSRALSRAFSQRWWPAPGASN